MPRRALGIPDRDLFREFPKKAPPFWQFAVQHHEAERAGPHFDLRLAPNRHAFSWALRKWPKPGEKALAILQPTHTRKYMTFEGVIPSGQYGAGKVKLHDHAKVRVVEYRPGMIKFVRYKGKEAEEYVLVKTKDKNWLLINTTTTPDKYKFPQWKPKYKELEFGEEIADVPGVMSPKVDGAHGLIVLQAGKHPRVFSVRRPVSGGVIEWTHKMPWLYKIKVPKGINAVLRGEVFLTDKQGRALPAQMTAGVLNSSIEKAIEDQKKLGAKLTIMPFAVANGKWEKRPYEQHLNEIQRISKAVPIFKLPEIAKTREEKLQLIQKIREGKHPLSQEGVVIWGERPYKAKITKEIDVYPTRVFPGKGKHKNRAGGFFYSLEPGGSEVGRVGGGLSDQLREELWKNKDKILGRVARVKFDKQMPSGSLYAPRFVDWHPDKDPGDYLNPEEAKKVLEMDPITKPLNKQSDAADRIFDTIHNLKKLALKHPEAFKSVANHLLRTGWLKKKAIFEDNEEKAFKALQKIYKSYKKHYPNIEGRSFFRHPSPDYHLLEGDDKSFLKSVTGPYKSWRLNRATKKFLDEYDKNPFVSLFLKDPIADARKIRELEFLSKPENLERVKSKYKLKLSPDLVSQFNSLLAEHARISEKETVGDFVKLLKKEPKLINYVFAYDPDLSVRLMNRLQKENEKLYSKIMDAMNYPTLLFYLENPTTPGERLTKEKKASDDYKVKFKIGYFRKMASFGVAPKEAAQLAKLATLSATTDALNLLGTTGRSGLAALSLVLGVPVLAGTLLGKIFRERNQITTLEDLHKMDTIAKYRAALKHVREMNRGKKKNTNTARS